MGFHLCGFCNSEPCRCKPKMKIYVVCKHDHFGLDDKAYTSEDEAYRIAAKNRNREYPDGTWVEELELTNETS